MANQHHHHHPSQLNHSLLLDTLYCSEVNNWEEEQIREEDYFQEHEEQNENRLKNNYSFPILLEQDLFWEDEELSSLFAKEEQNHLYKNLENNPSLARARQEAVEWMMKVNAHYSFTALTAVLAVNYLDRFLCSFHLQTEKPWMSQLAAVACLSLAAKVEETQVPLLLDLQVEDSRFLFEAKTIQRMEILVLSTLKWRMNPVTPLSFIDYITRRLGLKDYLCWEFLRRCECVVLSVITDARSMNYVPSVMATATMLQVINGVEPCIGTECQSQLFSILGVNKDNVEDCRKLVIELNNHSSQYKKRKFGSIPGSPKGVMDVAFSSDSSNDSWAVVSSVSSSPEPLSKKSRALQSLNHHSPTADFLTIPR